jgi:enterochelin esterase-like enzyme
MWRLLAHSLKSTAWSKTDTLLAVSYDNAKIRFYVEEVSRATRTIYHAILPILKKAFPQSQWGKHKAEVH